MGIIVFDSVLISKVIGAAEVFGMASNQAWLTRAKVVLTSMNGHLA
jgi:hypothetical protein